MGTKLWQNFRRLVDVCPFSATQFQSLKVSVSTKLTKLFKTLAKKQEVGYFYLYLFILVLRTNDGFVVDGVDYKIICMQYIITKYLSFKNGTSSCCHCLMQTLGGYNITTVCIPLVLIYMENSLKLAPTIFIITSYNTTFYWSSTCIGYRSIIN